MRRRACRPGRDCRKVSIGIPNRSASASIRGAQEFSNLIAKASILMTVPYKPCPTLRQALVEAEESLVAGPHPARARRDAETLLLLALRRAAPETNRAWLIAHADERLAPGMEAIFSAFMARRKAGEPVQYIAGETEFYGLSFHVNRDVLIPRPETELLVEAAIDRTRKLRSSRAAQPPRIVDVGTGSGAIAVALAHALPFAEIAAIDLSTAALAVAEANARRNGVAGRIRFFAGDLLAPVAGERFDLVVSNPPYVAERDRATLDAEVRNFEPGQALFAGEDGLGVYRRLLPAVFHALAAGGALLLEIGHGQQQALAELLALQGFAAIEFLPDLQGIARVALARRPESQPGKLPRA